MFQRDVGEVEVYAFEQQVGGDEGALVSVVEYGGIVAHTFEGRCVSGRKILGEVPYEAKLAEGGNIGLGFMLHGCVVYVCV